LLLASNRLSITSTELADGAYSSELSPGGLVTALAGLKDTTEYRWYGSPALDIPTYKREQLINHLKGYKATPVFVDKATLDLYYSGFSSMFLDFLMRKRTDVA